MELKSTIVTLNNLLRMNFEEYFSDFIAPQKSALTIPDYQREYKWDTTKIRTFAENIFQRSKFLGVITAEASAEQSLAIVDGQQRLTTIILMLVQLYNACGATGESETQNEIKELISCQIDGQAHFKLKNYSIGEYLHFVQNGNQSEIKLEIDLQADIYKQAKSFGKACDIINDVLNDRTEQITLDIYKQRLLDCEVLFFAQKNTSNLQQGSSEEIYIDINEKAQKLDPEDIFKGHCFAICKTTDQQGRVKDLWRTIKKQYFAMEKILKKADMGALLQFYLLTQEATKINRKDIKKDLTVGNCGENIIVNQFSTPTKTISLLQDISNYQSNLLSFASSLDLINQDFSQIITDTPNIIGNNRERLRELAIILDQIITSNQNLFKLPLFYFIHRNTVLPANEKSNYFQLSSFTYLYYIYFLLFSKIGGSRKRENLPNKLIRVLFLNQSYLIQFIREIIDYANGFDLDSKVMQDQETRKHLYTILDYFESSVASASISAPISVDTSLKLKLKLFPDTYNLEHLIINQSHKIKWHSAAYDENALVENTEYEFCSADFGTCPAWIGQNSNWANFIFIDSNFNRDSLKSNDIINKLILLRGSAYIGSAPTPGSFAKKHQHIESICQHIMRTEGFPQLLSAYHNNEPRPIVLECYRDFINNYFSEENMDILRANIKDQFVDKLNILQGLI